ncbi:hypothetical protein ILUMI_11503 [Ignelater luminosus]|uniref:Amine oxidase domain-containing protein n=1 Tax=Ignelater luminosus TaxID=2038154 RepID=A0A8K0CW38_IGNLU|nr:hypothetical protein ILUMI_11503 [Ignelater luminosus]
MWKQGGYNTILDILMKKYPNPQEQLPIEEKILLNKEVNKIVWEKTSENSKNVFIETSDGSVFAADYLIFTPSLGVLKNTHRNLFVPHLPEDKINAISKLGMGAISKISMHFPERWWPTADSINFIFVWSEEDKELIMKEFPFGPTEGGKTWLSNVLSVVSTHENSNILTAWCGGEFIPEIEKLNDTLITDGVMYIFNKFLGDKYNITRPDAILRNNWYENPHFRGTYSYETVESHKEGVSQELILAKPLKTSDGQEVVLFAGEATHPIYYSTVHGAIETGFREAQRIIDMHQ